MTLRLQQKVMVNYVAIGMMKENVIGQICTK